MAGIKVVHVRCKGGAPALTGALSMDEDVRAQPEYHEFIKAEIGRWKTIIEASAARVE